MAVNSKSSGGPAIHAATSGTGRELTIVDRTLVSTTKPGRLAIRKARRQLQVVGAAKRLDASADALIEMTRSLRCLEGGLKNAPDFGFHGVRDRRHERAASL